MHWSQFDWSNPYNDPIYTTKHPIEDAAFASIHLEVLLASSLGFRTTFSRYEQKVYEAMLYVIENKIIGKDYFTNDELILYTSQRMYRSPVSVKRAFKRMEKLMRFRHHMGLDPIPPMEKYTF